MSKNLDLTKKLKFCPSGTKLYSRVHGEVFFDHIDLINNDYPIITYYYNNDNKKIEISFTKQGKYNISITGETILFPSKDNFDWSKVGCGWEYKDLEKDTYVYCSHDHFKIDHNTNNRQILYRFVVIRKYEGNNKVYKEVNEKIAEYWNYIIPIDKCQFKGEFIIFNCEDNYGEVRKYE